jgi:hypothetical protein
MVDKVPTADEAYEQTQKQIVQKSGALFDKVVDAINAAASSFKTEAEINLNGTDRRMTQHLVDTLTATGYKVRTQDQADPAHNDEWTTVYFSWGKEKKK